MSFIERQIDRFITRITQRHYDFAIGGDENPYCLRWWVIPRNRFFNIYLHHFLRDDDDRALHDHPWVNCSIPLRTGYIEERFLRPWEAGKPLPGTILTQRHVGGFYFRRGSTPHRVILFKDQDMKPIPSWSLFITGPVLREWGFVCPSGRWVHWKIFTDFENTGQSGLVGRGCEE